MKLFGGSKSDTCYGILIDVGSGSVLTAIVKSDIHESHPEIIWSFREHAPLKNIDSLEQSSKAVLTALMNAGMKLDSEGRAVLRSIDPSAKLSILQCSIAAPWSYTVTKTINYSQDEDFTVTQDLVTELTTAIKDTVITQLKENAQMREFDLQVVAHNTTHITANGYPVKDPKKQQARRVSLSSSSAVTHTSMIAAITEVHDKLFHETDQKLLSFMLLMHDTTLRTIPARDVCLVDITYEATEIGVVRAGALTNCTHSPYGVFSLAREIAAIVNIPLHEAFGYLHSPTPFSFTDTLPAKQKAEVETLFEHYIEEISTLFHETGDTLAIPNQLAIHTDIKTESLFLNLIEKAAIRASKCHPHITLISSEIAKQFFDNQQLQTADTALLLSAMFFHNQHQSQTFSYT